MSAAQSITQHFRGEWHGNYGTIPTPGHSGKDRGTTVKDSDDGEVVFHSFNGSGDEFRDLKDECRRLGLLPERKASPVISGQWRETGVYAYRDAMGATLYRTIRMEKVGEPKRFVAQRLDGAQWIKGMGDVERIPYRLPELAAADPAQPIYFVEGERKADKLAGWGLIATAIAFGANGWRREYAPFFAGRTVVILPDNDSPGRAFAEKILDALAGVASAMAIVDLPGLPAKGDIMDWSGSAADLIKLTDAALHQRVTTLPLADLSMWAATAPTPKTFVMAGFVPEHELTLATGAGGANKSTFGQQLATCVVAGRPMLGVDVAQGSALYITAEDDENRLHWMQEHICKALGIRLSDLAGKLHLSSLRGRLGNELATFDVEGKLRPSPAFALLKATIADLAEAIDDPERSGGSLIRKLAGSMAVPAGVAQIARTVDPTLREAETVLDAVKARVPVLSKTLTPKRDIWGQPIENEGGLGPNLLSPVWTSTRHNDPINKAVLGVGAHINPPNRTVGKVKLALPAYGQFREDAGSTARAALGPLIASPYWQQMTDDERKDEIDDIMTKARREARGRISGRPPSP